MSILDHSQFEKVTRHGMGIVAIDLLRGQVADYEARRDGQVRRLQEESVLDFGDALIKARIAAGLTERQLADQLGIGEDEIERDEATDYESATLARDVEVAGALGLQISAEIQLPDRADDRGGTEAAADLAGSPTVPVTAGE